MESLTPDSVQGRGATSVIKVVVRRQIGLGFSRCLYEGPCTCCPGPEALALLQACVQWLPLALRVPLALSHCPSFLIVLWSPTSYLFVHKMSAAPAKTCDLWPQCLEHTCLTKFVEGFNMGPLRTSRACVVHLSPRLHTADVPGALLGDRERG